jgi:hypothetical protein
MSADSVSHVSEHAGWSMFEGVKLAAIIGVEPNTP